MLIRNVTLTSTSAEEAKKCLLRLFESRHCSIAQSTEGDVLEYSGLVGTSSLTQGYGLIAVVSRGGGVDIRIGLQPSLTMSGTLIALICLLASVPLIGLPLLLFLILHDRATSGVTHELDVLVNEIHQHLESPLPR